MIAAIYICPNSIPYLFGKAHEAITLNLGGRFFYKLGEKDGHTKILEKIPNDSYINGFWPNSISLLSAIVGANGTGKSTIIQLIKIGCQLVLEKDGSSEIIWTKNAGQIFYYIPYIAENRSVEDASNVKNISKLSQMNIDSKHENLDFSGHWEYHKSERLKRIISLIENKIYKSIFDELDITTFDKIKIRFSRISRNDDNVSRNFIPFFDELQKLKEKEWTKTEEQLTKRLGLKNKKDIESSKEYQKKSRQSRLYLTILDCIIKKIHSILESTGNKFLEEGFVNQDIETFRKKIESNMSTKEAFFWFINNAFFELKKNKYYLPIKIIQDFTNTLLSYVNENDHIDNWTILTLNFTETKKIIDAYQSFLLSFKDVFSYDETIFMTFAPDKTLSTGEISFYELFSALNYSNYRINAGLDIETYKEFIEFDDYILLLDEADLGFHPFWKKKYIKFLTKIIPNIFSNKNVQIIISTHDPLTLSDIPNSNIIYLDKREDGLTFINNNEKQSFGANIHDLLAHSFFLKDGLIGDFAKSKIEELITWLNDEYDTNKEYYKKLINLIDEPLLKYKLNQMYFEKFPKEYDKEKARKEIQEIANKNGLDVNFNEL